MCQRVSDAFSWRASDEEERAEEKNLNQNFHNWFPHTFPWQLRFFATIFFRKLFFPFFDYIISSSDPSIHKEQISIFRCPLITVFEFPCRWGDPTPQFVLEPPHLVIVSRPRWGRQTPSLLNIRILCVRIKISCRRPFKSLQEEGRILKRKCPVWLHLCYEYTIRCIIILSLTALQDLFGPPPTISVFRRVDKPRENETHLCRPPTAFARAVNCTTVLGSIWHAWCWTQVAVFRLIR